MPSLKISLPHSLPPAEAQARIQKLLFQLQTQFGGHLTDLRETWTPGHGEFAFKYLGFAVAAMVDIRPSTVDVEIKYPLAGLVFKSKMEAKIKEAASALLLA